MRKSVKRFKHIFIILSLTVVILLNGCGGGGTVTQTPDGPPGTIIVSASDPQPIASTAYGQNYYCWEPTWGDPIHNTQTQGASLKLNVMRAGGGNNDTQSPDAWTKDQVDEYIAYCRAIGAEPIFQVSILGGTATDAADWVDYCNNQKGYNVKYWIIGNEPDIYSITGGKPNYTVDNYCDDFRSYATVMKAKDPNIKIMGPEICWAYQLGNGTSDWWTPFLQNCHDVVDIVTFHRYPLAGQDCSIDNAMKDSTDLRALIQRLRPVVNQYCGPDRPMAITEANITADGDPNHSNYPASPQTLYAGLWVADTMGVALEEKLWTTAYWSFCEYWTNGFLDFNTKQPKPNYYGLYMYSNYFGSSLIHPTQVPSGLSVYASRDAGNSKTILMVINKTHTNLTESIQVTDLSLAVQKQHSFPSYSITCIAIPDDGSMSDIWTYSSAQSQNGSPPAHTTE